MLQQPLPMQRGGTNRILCPDGKHTGTLALASLSCALLLSTRANRQSVKEAVPAFKGPITMGTGRVQDLRALALEFQEYSKLKQDLI